MTKYFDGSIEELEQRVAAKMSDYRYQHSLRVRDYAKKLASQNSVDVEQAEVAALVHDYAKERTDEMFLTTIKNKHLDPDLANWGNYIWHGIVGAEIICDELGIKDPAILNAVREHTTGTGADMTLLSQVVFMADYLERGRTFPGVELARQITDQSLAAGVKYQIVHTVLRLVQKETAIYPKSITTYNYWIQKS